MKKLTLLLSVILLTACVSKKERKSIKVNVIVDNFSIENNLSDTPITNFIIPKKLACKSKPINLQVIPSIYRFSGTKIDTIKIIYKKNSVQNFLDSPVNETDAKNKLKKLEFDDTWKVNNFENSKSEIINFISNIDDNAIIFADKQYDFLSNFKNIDIIKNNETYINFLSTLFCKNKDLNSDIYIFYKLKSFNNKIGKVEEGKSGIGEGKPTSNNPCQTTTISSGLELKEELVKIIDTKRSTSERVHLAEQVWNKYFDNDAYVAKYLHEGDKNSEIWEHGEAKEYFTSRLAILKSIYDVNIIRIEYSKEDPTKISGIHIIECHNASQKI